MPSPALKSMHGVEDTREVFCGASNGPNWLIIIGDYYSYFILRKKYAAKLLFYTLQADSVQAGAPDVAAKLRCSLAATEQTGIFCGRRDTALERSRYNTGRSELIMRRVGVHFELSMHGEVLVSVAITPFGKRCHLILGLVPPPPFSRV